MSTIRRHFIEIDGRQVHYRSAGHGTAVLLIHQSPQNSRMWLDLMARLAVDHTVIAPDTPGFGYSDPLPGDPQTIAEFGAATLEFADALGLERFAVAGMHTGGLIATWLAWAHPERVAALVVDGYAAFTPEESAMYGDAYLPPFVPAWDGSHLRWLWARMREQKYFFPWYDGRAEAAMAIMPHTTRGTHEAVMDVLDVGDLYRVGYGAAFRHNDHHWASELRVPSWLVFRREDPLLAHMPRLRDLPAQVHCVEESGGLPALHANMAYWLGQALADEPVFQGASGGAEQGGWRRRIVPTHVGDIACWNHPGTDCLHLVLHAPGTAPLRPEDIPAAHEAWLVPDLPGHGASSETGSALDLDQVASALLAVIATDAGSLPIVLEAHGAAAGCVPTLARALHGRLREVVLHQPWLLNADEQAHLLQNLPRTVPDRAGGHLCDAWQWERERHLMWPWLPPSAQARRLVAAPDPRQVHANVVELLRLGERLNDLLRDTTRPDLELRLSELQVPLRVVTDSESDYCGRAAALANRCARRPA